MAAQSSMGGHEPVAVPAGWTCLLGDRMMAPEPLGRDVSETRVQNHSSPLHSPQLRAGAPQNEATHPAPQVPANSGSSEVKPLKPRGW